MKKLLLLSLFSICMAATADAQNWFSPEHHWVFKVSGGFSGFSTDFEMFAVSDTIIQGHPSRKWAFHSNGYYTLPPKYTYSDGPKAYYFDTQLDSFVKIYDFSLAVGDQVHIPREFDSFTYQIDTIDVVQAGDLTLKRQRVHYITPDGQPSNWRFDILENAGMVGSPFDVNYPSCSFVLIPDYACGSIVDGLDISFLCFSTPTGSFNPYSGTCMVTGTNNPENNNITVLPNPMTDYIDVKVDFGSAPFESLNLIDLHGRKIKHWEGGALRYPLDGIPAGVYFVEATFSNGTVVKKAVKI